eukprot:scaffold14274_cov215-Skeletonema_marinoi.AAC.1
MQTSKNRGPVLALDAHVERSKIALSYILPRTTSLAPGLVITLHTYHSESVQTQRHGRIHIIHPETNLELDNSTYH